MQNDELVLNRMIMLLAGSGMTSQQIDLTLRKIRNTDISIILSRVEKYRNTKFSNEVQISISYESNNIKRTSPVIIDNDALYRIERLIVKEAGLTKNMAAAAISASLKKRNPTINLPKFNPKEGFAKWLTQVASVVQLSEILHVAASIRNKTKHDSGDEWIKELI